MNRFFGNVVWTNHALERLKEREISQSDAWIAFRRPEKSEYAKTKNAWIFYRTFGKERIKVVAKQNDQKEWIILSVWSKNVTLKPKVESFWSFITKKVFKKVSKRR